MGEHMLLDVSEQDVEQVLNASYPHSGAREDNNSRVKSQTSTFTSSGKSGSGRRRIGERKSSRDPVGGQDGHTRV